MTLEEYLKLGERLFGRNVMDWAFVCPMCGYIATMKDYVDAGAPYYEIGYSCIGRYAGANRIAWGGKGAGPCTYSGGGLNISPLKVDGKKCFSFAKVKKNG